MILGIDWGEKKIGLAVAHEDMAIATALRVIKNDACVLDILGQITEEYSIDHFVIGRNAHDLQSDNTKKIDEFANQCSTSLGVNVDFASEMFSTREAHGNLIEAGQKKLAQKDDAEAARIILQHYIDAKNGHL